MNTIGLHHRFLVGCVGALFYVLVTMALAAAPADSRVLATSPDHPRTFWTGGWEQVDNYLQWNSDVGALEGHVTYGNVSNPNWSNPAYHDSFRVRFPGVHLNATEGRLYLIDAHEREVTIGHLQPGVFGQRVELEKNVDLSMHRHDGHLDAALVTGPN